ncbi:exodeoxyribonuclease VII large subunit [Campylobacter hyointestinalis]|uniref:exodeoxyribonuclease VII large subunit n=1 Tax=Campylobacter hyointestinalis TaxID=198 RepID=UPI000724740A|nr:exodeoxyribonuclease VII large subunit [Campylobacter hyointestinalis]PPB51878.1 exodeoxyribonuclease VII large subunit [Campylobacter hyointestinalis subsp. hyointestinalis]PPB66076.1 exodeoxyribonuclease VII large subunit [Campylobacter hyointestinalis subsp. hyointestinalis]PPB68898.1 exodeoxyribonuclease VII large subunit [Campylobacter hyointestinalis subsp. hyointestinalis]CUU80954.1 exodeoxyribonuclease VII large subunit [Campylobacter hyointestinalis subsp. hyointestinalis]CUU81687.
MTVSELNEQAKTLLETHFSFVEVTGEISRLIKHSSGHWYFSLKDEKSVISTAMYKFSNQSVKFDVKDGLKVTLQGKLTIYPPSGSYQLLANKMLPEGVGELELAFNQLKEKLEREGLFDLKFKKSLPKFPKKVALITSLTSAAYQDMLKVIGSRFKLCEFVAFNTLVQGENAAENIINVLNKVDKMGFDALVLARGGGSKEDLWCFNDESLARTIFALQTPLISAIGHEIDYSISDFVSDHRSLTPTAAMMDLLPDELNLMQGLDMAFDTLTNCVNQKVQKCQNTLDLKILNLKNQALSQKIEKLAISLENKKANLNNIVQSKLVNQTHKLREFELIFYEREQFFKATKNMVQIEKDGKLISLEKLKKEDIVKLYSQNAQKQAIIKS